MDFPNITLFGKFITTSMAFTSSITNISVIFNDFTVLSVEKKMPNIQPISIPKSISAISPTKLFYLKNVFVRKIQLEVQAFINFVSLNNPGAVSNFTMFMRVATGGFEVKPSSLLIKDMERTTKKKPPKTTETHVMWSTYDEYDASFSQRGKSTLFDDLIPTANDQGKVFIGYVYLN